ncbi:MAG: hypothetical protein SGI90_07275 [Candidatus Eisenbacteria bacterium]|nr:hypothetical protein [Candidatus Eisenbacteria bacterium]
MTRSLLLPAGLFLLALTGCAGSEAMTAAGRRGGGSTVLTSARHADTPPIPTSPIAVTLTALNDTVVAHQTAWIEVRIKNNGAGGLDVPNRARHLVADWRFEDGQGRPKHEWQGREELEKAPVLRLGPGETLYEVISLESSFGVLTEPGTIRAWCRVRGEMSPPIEVSRVATTADARPSILRDSGPLLGTRARDNIQVKLWSACAGNGKEWFDCDEALYTVAWDRMQGAPLEAQAIVDTLIARHPTSGWCRPAIHDLLERLPEAAGRRWIEAVIDRHPGGVAERYADEMLRRAGFGQLPAAR